MRTSRNVHPQPKATEVAMHRPGAPSPSVPGPDVGHVESIRKPPLISIYTHSQMMILASLLHLFSSLGLMVWQPVFGL